jgi:hypothetical protein
MSFLCFFLLLNGLPRFLSFVRVVPYQIALHDGRLIFAPQDTDQVIRLRPPPAPDAPSSPEYVPNEDDFYDEEEGEEGDWEDMEGEEEEEDDQEGEGMDQEAQEVGDDEGK